VEIENGTQTQGLFVVGLNHLTAAVACRERAAIPTAEAEAAAAELKSSAGLSEIVILSTCSRTEVIACAADAAAAALTVTAWFMRRGGSELGNALYARTGGDAVRHVFRVACGLDSWIIGESEILAQVKRAYQFSQERRWTASKLNRVFQMAIAAGKAVRAQTGIQNGIHSIGGAGALLARRIFSTETEHSILVVGAGEAAEAVAKHLCAKNFKKLTVANRTLERAQALAAKLGGEAVTFEKGLEDLSEVEAVVFSASCPEVLLKADDLKRRIKDRRKPLFLIDLGVPRNVDSACGGVEGVYLYNLDDLKGVVAQSMSAKSSAKEEAERLAAAHVGDCVNELEKAAARRPTGVAS
jgi:glutamyl-tRNA reductase